MTVYIVGFLFINMKISCSTLRFSGFFLRTNWWTACLCVTVCFDVVVHDCAFVILLVLRLTYTSCNLAVHYFANSKPFIYILVNLAKQTNSHWRWIKSQCTQANWLFNFKLMIAMEIKLNAAYDARSLIKVYLSTLHDANAMKFKMV